MVALRFTGELMVEREILSSILEEGLDLASQLRNLESYI
jgi:hypothetical protein